MATTGRSLRAIGGSNSGSMKSVATALSGRTTSATGYSLKAMSALNDYSTLILGDSPKVYMRMEETVPNDLTDSSGNSWPVVMSGGSESTETGLISGGGNARKFQSRTATITPSTTASPSGFTLECWVKVHSYNGSVREYLVHWLNTPSSTSGVEIGITATGYFFAALKTSAAAATEITSISPLTLNQTYHVAMRYAGITMYLYVNGALQSSNSKTGTLNFTDAHIGNYQVGDRPTTDSTIDEAALYDYDIGADKILAHYNAGI